ncbi:MAG TPA: DUF493 domain-containing protein [Chloroflexi bacterium]|jgi:putative lipoic acid-binding regulatory protein|nr:DUF493 domain-containing protein [Chloroflexota bacterium]
MLDFRKEGMEFPTPFALKIIGRDEDGFTEFAVAIVREYAPDLNEHGITTRLSSGSNYISVTVPFTAESREQLDAIYRELTGSERVLMVI